MLVFCCGPQLGVNPGADRILSNRPEDVPSYGIGTEMVKEEVPLSCQFIGKCYVDGRMDGKAIYNELYRGTEEFMLL